jgi:hypothetical protein
VFLGCFGRKSSETLSFPGKWRKRHAETIEPSGKSVVKQAKLHDDQGDQAEAAD